jgi:hypothetical protein
MSYLRGFIPWIAFAVIPGWQWGALAALVLSLGLLVQARRSQVPLDSQILEISTLAFFAALTVLAFSAPHSALEHYDGAFSTGWLALTAWATLTIRRPFTLGIAKQQAPREVWDSPVFLRINVVITAAWAIAFTVAAVLQTGMAVANVSEAVRITVQVLAFAIPATFTARYPKRVQARYAA